MECRSKGQGLHIEALGRHRTEIKALSKARKTHANNQKGNLMTAKTNFSSFIITPQQRSPLRTYLSWKQMQKSWSFPQGLWLPLFSWKIFNHSVTLFFFFFHLLSDQTYSHWEVSALWVYTCLEDSSPLEGGNWEAQGEMWVGIPTVLQVSTCLKFHIAASRWMLNEVRTSENTSSRLKTLKHQAKAMNSYNKSSQTMVNPIKPKTNKQTNKKASTF